MPRPATLRETAFLALIVAPVLGGLVWGALAVWSPPAMPSTATTVAAVAVASLVVAHLLGLRAHGRAVDAFAASHAMRDLERLAARSRYTLRRLRAADAHPDLA